MAFPTEKYVKVVLSTDAKPSGAKSGERIIESDTGDVYAWTGASWQKVKTAGATNIA